MMLRLPDQALNASAVAKQVLVRVSVRLPFVCVSCIFLTYFAYVQQLNVSFAGIFAQSVTYFLAGSAREGQGPDGGRGRAGE